MVEQSSTPAPNVVDFVDYQLQRQNGRAMALQPRMCRHCGAILGVGESEDDCSTILLSCTPVRM